jgi:hypothetical protein
MKSSFLFIAGLMIALTVSAKNIVFENTHFRISIDERGYVVSVYDKFNNKEYLPEGHQAPLFSIRYNGEIEHPSQLKKKNNAITVLFSKSKVEAQINAVVKTKYISFELASITQAANVEVVMWGPYPTTIRETIGESVGVVRNGEFAFGIQSLNVKTLGGYPTEENDIEPSSEVFEAGKNIDITAEWRNKKAYRGQTAKVQDFGSSLQAYCRNRNKERIISNWGHDYYVAPPFNDGGVAGSKIALFGCHAEEALDVIGEIELAEGLPHPMIGGKWAKKSPAATASFIILGFGESNLDDAIKLAKKAGLEYLYHGDPFKKWGHFILDEKAFPQNWVSMKRCVDRAHVQGIKLGVHTLTNFITTNDPYVTPVPDKRLAKVGESILSGDIDANSKEILIESPQFFNQMENNSLHSVVIGNEIIRYKDVSREKPWKLTECVRGAFDTRASAHKKGDRIGKLMDHGYNVFLSDALLSEEIAKNLARFFNETDVLQTSFDGLEGTWASGMGQYGRNLFTKVWYDNLKPELRGKIINDASNPSHFNWHVNTRYNWGEPWYAGFRESQTTYRLMNQDFFQRNLLPAMLGWFSMSGQTSIEDTEWLLARAAGFNAGFAFNLSFETVRKNGQGQEILGAINNWETARMAGAFSAEQKSRMQDISNEYHLEPVSTKEWKLYPYQVMRYVHEQKIRQPGEPLFSTFEFNNANDGQPLMFLMTLLPIENNSGSTVEKVFIEVNNYHKIEIPVRIESFQTLKLNESGELQLFDRNWNLLKTIELQNEIPNLSEGENKIIFDAEFSGDGVSRFKIEVKTRGKAEVVKSK